MASQNNTSLTVGIDVGGTNTDAVLVDGTELGDALAVGGVPHRLGWEPREHWQEPSAPPDLDRAEPIVDGAIAQATVRVASPAPEALVLFDRTCVAPTTERHPRRSRSR